LPRFIIAFPQFVTFTLHAVIDLTIVWAAKSRSRGVPNIGSSPIRLCDEFRVEEGSVHPNTFIPRRMVRVRNFGWATLLTTVVVIPFVWCTTAPVQATSPGVPFRLMDASIAETQAALTAGTITSVDLVNMYLARIQAYDKQGPAINAVLKINPH